MACPADRMSTDSDFVDWALDADANRIVVHGQQTDGSGHPAVSFNGASVVRWSDGS